MRTRGVSGVAISITNAIGISTSPASVADPPYPVCTSRGISVTTPNIAAPISTVARFVVAIARRPSSRRSTSGSWTRSSTAAKAPNNTAAPANRPSTAVPHELLPRLRAVDSGQVFDAELDMVIGAIRGTAR